MVCSGICHGTLGELIQGPYVHEGEQHISLISLPVKKYSCMHFTHGLPADQAADLANKSKCRRAIDLYVQLHGLTLPPGKWRHDSELLEGKGMASSTADLVATIRCLDAMFGNESTPEAIAAILRRIERSDSVFLDHYALYLSARQQVVQTFRHRPTFHACYIDEGDSIDTERIGPALLETYREYRAAYETNLHEALDAFASDDLARIAACATVSACLGQHAVAKRCLGILLARQQQFGADGIFVAHTGSLLGYLFIEQPGVAKMGALSSFFHALGYQCRFVQTGY